VSGCRWIKGDDFLAVIHAGGDPFCGAPTIGPERSWCAEHRARCFYRWGEQEIAARPAAPIPARTKVREPVPIAGHEIPVYAAAAPAQRSVQTEATPALLAGIASSAQSAGRSTPGWLARAAAPHCLRSTNAAGACTQRARGIDRRILCIRR
jgi:hypothetical protein